MTIQRDTWNRFTDILAAIDRTAARKFTAYLNTHDISTQEGRKAAIDYAAALADKYGESAAAMACEMYDSVAAASGAILPAAEPAAAATYGEVAKTVNGMAKQNAGSDAMGSAIGRMVKRTGVDTTVKNAIRDGAEWAWIPSGDSCAFCLTLASRGWQRASKKALKNGHAEHIHSNCDCTYAIRFDGKSNVAGYDPDALYERYQSAEGNTPQEKINSMRRENYDRNSDKIRAQKRDNYARRIVDQKEYLGVPKTWDKDLDVSDDKVLSGTNPNYKPGLSDTARKEERDYNDNCANCVVAYEMRCRGYNVTAQPLSANKKLRSNPFSAWQDGEKKRLLINNINELLKYMDDMPDGSRVQIAVDYQKNVWDSRPGHTCIISRENGKNIFKDPQRGGIIDNTDRLFSNVETIGYLRIDDLEVTDRGISACRREALK